MKTHKSLLQLSDNVLVRNLERLCDSERETLVKVLGYLIEMERRELYLLRGYGSLHEFCTGHLKYSSSASGRRITAARCVKKYPRVAGMLLRGEINLSVLLLVKDMLSPQNYRDILSRIKGRSYRDVRRLVARYHPQSEIRDRVKPVYIKTELKISSGDGDTSNGGNSGHQKGGEKSTPDVGSSASLESTAYGDIFASGEKSGQSCVVLEEKYKLEFAVDPEFMELFGRLKALLSNKRKKKLDFENLFKIVMREYLDRHSPEGRVKRRAEAKKSKGKTQKQHKSNKKSRAEMDKTANSKQSRYIPQAVRDEVFVRDGGRCTYVGTNGKRCPEDQYLQVDHIVPFAIGGKNTIDNLRLVCPSHNMLLAEHAYGKDHMNQYRQRE